MIELREMEQQKGCPAGAHSVGLTFAAACPKYRTKLEKHCDCLERGKGTDTLSMGMDTVSIPSMIKTKTKTMIKIKS